MFFTQTAVSLLRPDNRADEGHDGEGKLWFEIQTHYDGLELVQDLIVTTVDRIESIFQTVLQKSFSQNSASLECCHPPSSPHHRTIRTPEHLH